MKKLLFFLTLFPVLGFGQQVINLDPSSLGALNALLLLDQDIIWVSSGNTTGIETGTMIYPYNTIQEGLDAASAGNVVLVIAGTYSESLSMATNGVRLMTLEGQTVEVELLQSSNRGLIITGDSVIIGGGSGMGFTFTADGGRMIELAANEVDCEISYNTIIVDAGGTIGVNVGAAGATRLKVKNNLFKVSSGTGGIYATKNLIDAEISGNEFIGESIASGYAIQLSGFYGGIIKDNYIHADTTDGVKGFASGIFPHTNTTDAHVSDSLKISNNIVLNCANGIRLGHANNANMSEIYVYGNKIQWCTDGIEIYNDAEVLPATYDIYDNIFAANTTNINNQHATAPNVGLNEFDESIAVRSITPGNIDLDYAASTADADETRHFDYTVTGTVDPAASAGVNAGYFAYNKTAGSNGTYTINALEGVVRSSYADENMTARGVYGRVYINADATSTMRTGVGGEFSARAGYSGGTDVIAESGTGFIGTRIWMAPYFTAGSLGNIDNFHGLWIFNEHTSNKVTNAIRINDYGGTGGWTNGINLSSATIGTADIILNQGATLFNSDANTLTITEPTVAVVGALQALKTTEQFRLSYDATNYMTVTLLDDGHTTFTTVDPDGAEADINFTPDGNVGIKTAAPSTALEVTGTTTTTDAIITTMATTNTTVLTPTATGQVDTLETVDFATEDFTVTGLWTFDNLVADSIQVDSMHVNSYAQLDKVSITNGTISGTDITVGAGKTLDVSAGTLTLADNQISGDKVEGGTIAAITITDLTSDNTIIDSANIDTASITYLSVGKIVTTGTPDLLLHNGATINNIRAGNLTITEDTITVSGISETTTMQITGSGSTNPNFFTRDLDLTMPDYSSIWTLPTGTNLWISQSSTTKGGGGIRGFTVNTPNTPALTISGYSGIPMSTNPAVVFVSWKSDGGTSRAAIASTETGFEFRNGATPLIDILGSGYTGILTAAPTQELDVTGDALISDTLFANVIIATGNISGCTNVTLDTDPAIVLTAEMCRNAARFNNDADVIDYTLPGAAAGIVVLFYDIAGGVITIDPVDGTDEIYLNGTSVGAGDAIDSPGAVGDFICLMAVDDTRWVTIGRSGTWVDGGAD